MFMYDFLLLDFCDFRTNFKCFCFKKAIFQKLNFTTTCTSSRKPKSTKHLIVMYVLFELPFGKKYDERQRQSTRHAKQTLTLNFKLVWFPHGYSDAIFSPRKEGRQWTRTDPVFNCSTVPDSIFSWFVTQSFIFLSVFHWLNLLFLEHDVWIGFEITHINLASVFDNLWMLSHA